MSRTFRVTVVAFGVSLALSGVFLTSNANAMEDGGPVCSTNGNQSCGCNVVSCSTVNGETRCTVFCKFRYIWYT